MNAPVDLSVLLITHNSAAVLPSCLEHLRRAVETIPHEVIVVDNASADATLTVVARVCPEARLIINTTNRGYAAAVNQAAETAAGEFLLLLNPDAYLDTDAVAALLAVARAERRAGLVAARLRFPDGRFQPNCRRLPSVGNLLWSRGSLLARMGERWFGRRSHVYTLPDYDQVTIVPAAAATVALIRRDTFARVDGFDERFFLFMEDTDLCARLQEAGYVNLFVPQAGAVHVWGRGAAGGKVRRAWHHHAAVARYFRKHHAGAAARFLLPVLLGVNFVMTVLLPDRRPET